MWNQVCAEIFSDFTASAEKENIRCFVLRNYETLPEENPSKDVDIIIEPGKIKRARRLLKEIYRKRGMEYYHYYRVGRVHCMHGISASGRYGIHIDLIEGYLSKGYEIFSFDELYSHTIRYRNFIVLESFFAGVLLLIYKLFGYRNPKLKAEYRETIYEVYQTNPEHYISDLARLTNSEFASRLCSKIAKKDFDSVIKEAPEFTKYLKRYARRRIPLKTIKNRIAFFGQKFFRCGLFYRKYKKVFAVLAPDGTGKTTFLDALLREIDLHYVNYPEDRRCNVLHFRPTILPNLGEVGEKTGVMKQDTDFTNPHRKKPANPFSSFLRISYYTLDYIIGWQKIVRRDVRFDRFTVFDRYSYDFIVDPLRTRLNLPKGLRKFFVFLTPKPKAVFVLYASSEVIYRRKQELTLEEIERQSEAYAELSEKNRRFIRIDAEQTPERMASTAMKVIMDRFAEKL